jgi:UDP-4-amino-4,6-dideoxy-N-acetyl-beta-L-altrosamine transaminase
VNRDEGFVSPPVSPPKRLLTYGHQCIGEDDRQAVLRALDSDWLTQGPAVDRFEAALAERFGVRHAVVCANGTAALHLAALGLEWKPGDVVIAPAITFVASSNCALYVGAEASFVDIQPDTLTIDPNEVEREVKRLRAQGKRPRAVVGVDLAGHPADWKALREIADRYDLHLVDDACHAMGATYDGVAVGSCKDPEVSILSFHPVKHITTGEGGAILTNDDTIAARVRMLRTHGIVRGEADVPDWEGPWHLEMVALGYNYRLTDLQCALGLSQLHKLDAFVAKRRTIAAWYDELLRGDGVFQTPKVRPGIEHAYHLYVMRTAFGTGDESRRAFFERVRARGIQLQVHYRPVPMNSYYADKIDSGTFDRLPVSMQYYSECFSCPMYPELEHDDIEYVVDVLRSERTAQ